MEPNLKWLRTPKKWLLIQPGMGTGTARTRGSFPKKVSTELRLVDR